MEQVTKVTPEQAEKAWKIYHLLVDISSLIMPSIFGPDPEICTIQPKYD